jgi:EAL domain-containing protein (putative c-di-GMP-specific phosphodiesterase class I)
MIRRILKETGLDPQYLEIELTESVLMADADETAAKLDELKKMGITISIDDFGTGYSSLSYLKRFPIDLLKIDRSFVDGLVTDPNDTAIVTTIIVMAHALNMRVVAEGVETREQQEFLLQHRCEEVQGYYFSRPLPANDLEAWMTGNCREAIGDC